MEDDREKVFAAIRRGLRGSEKFSADRDTASPLKTRLDGNFDSLFARFKSEISLLGGEAVTADTEVDAAEIVVGQTAQNSSIFIYDDIRTEHSPFTATMTESRRSRFGLEYTPGYDKHDVAGFDCVVAGCVACVAETGTVVMSPDMRLPGALASKLFVVVESKQLIPSLDELFSDRFSGFRGSNLFLITGPSRTADIEKQLVRGVHGPKDVIVIFLKH